MLLKCYGPYLFRGNTVPSYDWILAQILHYCCRNNVINRNVMKMSCSGKMVTKSTFLKCINHYSTYFNYVMWQVPSFKAYIKFFIVTFVHIFWEMGALHKLWEFFIAIKINEAILQINAYVMTQIRQNDELSLCQKSII